MLTRREILGAAAAGFVGASLVQAADGGSAAALVGKGLGVQPQDADTRAAAFGGKHPIVPLPFKPDALRGISEKLIVSHHDNNYAGAVKNLNRVEIDLASVTKDTPPFVVGGLKQAELSYRNSVVLHEQYFGNLGGDGKSSGPVQAAVASAWGTFGRFEESFRATGMSLGGGSGWTVLGLDIGSGSLVIYWSGNHTQAAASVVPLLVLDMYEHAYQMDYGAAAAKYVEAFFGNVEWAEVNRRYERASKAVTAFRGS